MVRDEVRFERQQLYEKRNTKKITIDNLSFQFYSQTFNFVGRIFLSFLQIICVIF